MYALSQILPLRMPRLSQRLLSFVMLGVSVAIAGCAGNSLPASVVGGECKVFERPEYAVRGKRRYDQDWIDSQVEGGVGGCGWKRPKPRPASFDAPRTKKPVPLPPKKRTLVERITAPFTKPVEPVIESPAVPMLLPVPKPRDAVDELLQPSKDQQRLK